MLPLPLLAALDAIEVSNPAERQELLERVYDDQGAALVRLARIFTDDRNAAEDIVQEAFIRLYRSAHRVDDPSKVPAYMRSVVLNLCRDHNRRGLMSLRHQQTTAGDERTAPSPDIEVVRSESQGEVIDALLELSARQRECLVLRFYLELSETEIAATLGISPNSVKTHSRRGMATLRERLAVPA
jgi:RNA polymerase sigma-70 factor (sigma-E family)